MKKLFIIVLYLLGILQVRLYIDGVLPQPVEWYDYFVSIPCLFTITSTLLIVVLFFIGGAGYLVDKFEK